MRKHEELSNPKSCFSKAQDSELMFVILGRDIAAQDAIYAWIRSRISHGKNHYGDKQITEAFEIAERMKEERYKNRKI